MLPPTIGTVRTLVLAAALLGGGAGPASAGPVDYLRSLLEQWFGASAPPPPAAREVRPPSDPFDALPSIGLEKLQHTVREAAGALRINVRRGFSDVRSEVRIVTKPGTATVGKDFTALEQTLIFDVGETEKTVEIAIIDDEEHEREEVFTVEIADAVSAGLTQGATRAVVTITDDDKKPVPPSRPVLAFEPPAAVFGAMPAGEKALRELLLRNDGPPVTVARLRIVGPDAFKIVEDGCSGQDLPTGATCAVTVEMSGARASAYVAGLEAEARSSGGVWRNGAKLSGVVEAPVVREDPMAARVAALRAQRRAAGGILGSTHKPPEEAADKDRFRVKDEDYALIGIGRNYFTLPVDRSRIITTDRFIGCVLEDTVNSQLPGFLTCVVERPVYGSDQRFVLIPAGSRAVGKYESLAKSGDTRLNVVWSRFIRPDGGSIAVVDGFQTADQAGRTGVPGHIDNRFLDRFGGALLLTGLTVGTALAIPQDDAQFSSAFESLADNLGQIGTQMLEENLDLTPVITIAAGTRLVIRPLVDLWLPEPDVLAPLTAGQPAAQPAAGG